MEHHQTVARPNNGTPGCWATVCISVRAGGGGRGGRQPPQLQQFLKFFGQNADDSGKSTREKTLWKAVKARLLSPCLPCQDGVKAKWSNDPGNLFWKSHVSFTCLSWKSTRWILLPWTKEWHNQNKKRPRRFCGCSEKTSLQWFHKELF